MKFALDIDCFVSVFWLRGLYYVDILSSLSLLETPPNKLSTLVLSNRHSIRRLSISSVSFMMRIKRKLN